MDDIQSIMTEENENTEIKELKRKLNFDQCEPLLSQKICKSDFDINEYEPSMIRKLHAYQNNVRTLKMRIFKHMFVRKYICNDLVISFEDVYINIGTYGYSNESKSVFLSKDGLTFFVPTFKNGRELKILNIGSNKIIRILIYPSKTNPMIFFSVSNDIAGYIRNLLSMVDPNEPYFNPESNDLKHQYIVITPARMNDECKDHIKYLFTNKNLIEIEESEIDNYLAPLSAAKEFNDKQDDNLVYSLSHSEMRTLYSQIMRVGSYEFTKKRVFSISTKEFIFCVPFVKRKIHNSTIIIKMDQIVKILIRFSDTLPILFFYITTEAAELVRNILSLDNSRLDPNGNSVINKIIIFPQEIPQDCDVIKALMNEGKIHKVEDEDAHKILAISVLPSKFIKNIHFQSLELEVNSLSLGPVQLKHQMKLEMSYLYIKLYIPLNGGLHINIDFIEVTKFLYHISKDQLNILQLFVTSSAEYRIRSLLKYIGLDRNSRLNQITIALGQPGNNKRRKIIEFLKKIPFIEKLRFTDAQLIYKQLQNNL